MRTMLLFQMYVVRASIPIYPDTLAKHIDHVELAYRSEYSVPLSKVGKGRVQFPDNGIPCML